MTAEHEIGRVVSVDTSELMVELNRDLKALTRSTYEGAIEVGRINSYLIIPVGSRRIVAMVTRVELTEASEPKTDKTMVSLPSTRRLLKATMIGSIDENQFRQGINLFPVLDSKVFLTTKEDLDSIFGKISAGVDFNPDEPGYCIPVGKSAVFPDYEIKIDPDAFFGKHAAIIGSTGSGKSCSIATILQSVISDTRVTQTRIVILDTNGEYRSAFQRRQLDGRHVEAFPNRRSLYIPTDSAAGERLVIPYWFMDADDFGRLFRAAPGVQRPVLLNALTLARQERLGPHWTLLRDTLIQECHRILALTATGTWQDRNSINVICDGVVAALGNGQNQTTLRDLVEQYPSLQQGSPSDVFGEVKTAAGRRGAQDFSPLGMAERQRSESLLNGLMFALATVPAEGLERGTGSADWPSYFSKATFRYRHLETAMSRDQTNSTRTRDNCSTMLTRIYRLLEDSRFEFLFGPCAEEWPTARHALAIFLRNILGLESRVDAELSTVDELATGLLPFYDRQRAGAGQANIVIIDLSLLASEVLENVTALIGRLIHEFLQRLSDPISGVGRGEFPVVLVLEEAQNYIRETGRSEEDSISKQVFERIAREGRKYGLGLVVASQRPSELSKTVLSQCNSFIVHRLQNPEDLRYFREIVPGIYVQLLNQLPALAPRSALVLGECVQLRQHKRVMFVEGTFEEPILRTFANKLGEPIPPNAVFWVYSGGHTQRRILFEQLRLEIPGLQGLSIRDRDSLELADVRPDLTEHNHRDQNGLRLRTWRRRHFDNYLLLPAAICRTAGQPEEEITQFLSEHWGLAVGSNPTASNCCPGLLDARGKEILAEGLPIRNTEPAKPSIEATFGCSRHDIAGRFEAVEVPEDIQAVLREIREMCQAATPVT